MLDENGQVVGIVVTKRTDAAGMAYLIPVNRIRDLLKQGRGWAGYEGRINLSDLALVCLKNKKDNDAGFEFMKECVFWQPGWALNSFLNEPVFDGLRSRKDYQLLMTQNFSTRVDYGFFNDDLVLTNQSGHPLTDVFIFVTYVENGQLFRARTMTQPRWYPDAAINLANFASLKKDGVFVTQFTIHIISDQYMSARRWAGVPGHGVSAMYGTEPADKAMGDWGLGNGMAVAGQCLDSGNNFYLSAPAIWSVPDTIDKGGKLVLVARMGLTRIDGHLGGGALNRKRT